MGNGSGFGVHNWSELDISNVPVDDLNEISRETGVDFPIEADPETGRAKSTPESIVVNVGNEEKG
ncbi:MAG: hypothetical protein AAB954_02260 [Patescibacteria group bacterium]